jgi:hypothetical protein
MSIGMVFIRVSLILLAVLVLGCSNGENNPTIPPVYFDGEITITNDSDVNIRLVDFTQRRGSEEYSAEIDVRVYTNQRYLLWNYLDGGNTHVFPGGDRVWVTFVSTVQDPNDPNNPLFENTASLTVNGNSVIVVKSGGEYSFGEG